LSSLLAKKLDILKIDWMGVRPPLPQQQASPKQPSIIGVKSLTRITSGSRDVFYHGQLQKEQNQ
jgi:hypothetical protein